MLLNYICTMQKKFKRILIDGAGYGLILLGIATGWLPGPGGIPLILTGLGLLSVNNHWAKQILEYLQQNGSKFMKLAFPDNTWAKAGHDFLALLLLCASAYIFVTQNSLVYFGFAIALAALGIVDFLYNRNRLKYFKKHK